VVVRVAGGAGTRELLLEGRMAQLHGGRLAERLARVGA